MQMRHDDMLKKIREGAIRAFGEQSANSFMNKRWKMFDDRTPEEMARRDADAERVLQYVRQLTNAEEQLKRAGIRNSEQ